MRRFFPTPNLTAILALAALAELVLFRVVGSIFLSNQQSSAERWLAGLALFSSNLSGILGLILTVIGLSHALRSDRIFPRSMRITVSTIGLFFSVLAAMGVLLIFITPRYNIHLRISHGFLVFFLALGFWYRAGMWRSKLAVTLFALPIVIQASALFCQRMTWTRIDPAHLVLVGHALNLMAMTAAPVLLTPWPWTHRRTYLIVGIGLLLATGCSLATILRFDLVQAVAFYGLHIDLTGLTTSAERIYTGAVIAAFTCLGVAAVGCLAVRGPSRLAGWGLLLLAASGMEISSPKLALFSLCGLLALAIAGARANNEEGQADVIPAR
jgi:hypothetical protein